MTGIVSVSLGGLMIKSSSKTDALELTVNSFSLEKDIYLEDVETILVSIKEIQLSSKNIDDTKDAEISVYGSIGGNDIGELTTEKVNVESNSITTSGPYQFDIRNGEKFKPKYLTVDEYIDQSNIEIKLDFRLNHPSLNETVTDQSTFIVGFADGEFLSNTFQKASSKDMETKGEKYKSIEASDLSVWNISDRFTKLKTVMKGGQPTNNSSYSLPKGVIDINKSEFQVSPRGSLEISLSEPNNSKYGINKL